MAATFQTASLLSIIEQGQKMESLFVRVLLEAAMKLSTITDANIFVIVETGHGRKWAGRRALKDEFLQGKLRNKTEDEEIYFDDDAPASPIVIPRPPSVAASDVDADVPPSPSFDAARPESAAGDATEPVSSSPFLMPHPSSTPSGLLIPSIPSIPASIVSNLVPHLLTSAAAAAIPHPLFSSAASLPALQPYALVEKQAPGPPPAPSTPDSCSPPINDAAPVGGATFGAGGAVILPGGAVLPRLQHMGEISASTAATVAPPPPVPPKVTRAKKKRGHSEGLPPLPPPQHQSQTTHLHQHQPQFSFSQFVPTIVSGPSDSPAAPAAASTAQGNNNNNGFATADDEDAGAAALSFKDLVSKSGADELPPPPPLHKPEVDEGAVPPRPLVGSQKRKVRATVGHLLQQKEKMMRMESEVGDGTVDLASSHSAADDSGVDLNASFGTPRILEVKVGGGGGDGNSVTGENPKRTNSSKLVPIRPKTKSKVHLTFQDENHIETNAFPPRGETGGGGESGSAGGADQMALELCDPNPLIIAENATAASETPPRKRGPGLSGPPFFCEICSHEFSKPHHLSRHKKEQHTNVQGHPCMFCQHKFKRKEHLRRHVLSRHRMEIPDSEEAQKLFEAPPPTAAQAAAAAAAAVAAFNSVSMVDSNGLLLLPNSSAGATTSTTSAAVSRRSQQQSLQHATLMPPTLSFMPPLSPALNAGLVGPRGDEFVSTAAPSSTTPSETAFDEGDGDAYFVETEGMTTEAEDDAGSSRGTDGPNDDVIEDDDEDVDKGGPESFVDGRIRVNGQTVRADVQKFLIGPNVGGGDVGGTAASVASNDLIKSKTLS